MMSSPFAAVGLPGGAERLRAGEAEDFAPLGGGAEDVAHFAFQLHEARRFFRGSETRRELPDARVLFSDRTDR